MRNETRDRFLFQPLTTGPGMDTIAAGADRLGQERSDHPCGRGRAVPARLKNIDCHLLDAGHFAPETN
jgi:hypothetical protein